MTHGSERRPQRAARLALGAVAFGLATLAIAMETRAQVTPGTNVNMVSGASFPDGDPFLQRQNEPSLAASTRNPLHLLAGANDYRTVDLPGPFDPLRGERMNADAWLGLYTSFDGGRTWRSTLLPGYPQDITPEGAASPIKGRQAGTDPVVRAGTNGLFYYAGLAFDRGQLAPSAIFVARFIDRNDREDGDSIAYLGTRIVDQDTSARFLDKTALAVDAPRGTATCTIDAPLGDGTTVAQTIPAGRAYVAYAAFRGAGPTERSRIMFSRSTDCGATWSRPIDLSGEALYQNAQIAIDPVSGAVYVSWRTFGSGAKSGILIVTSHDGGVTFTKPHKVAVISPFDQGTTGTSFRTNAFQAMTIDASGQLYIAWTERGFAAQRPDRTTGDARIVVTTSLDGVTWTPRRAIDTGGLGHHLMPSLTFHGGKLRLLYYTLQEDVSQLFGPYVDEAPILAAPDPKPPRHTIDVYVGQALPGPTPAFTIRRVSDYAFGVLDGSPEPQRLQYNPPNLPLFRQGTVPFLGDYLDLAPAPAFVQLDDGTWAYNDAPEASAISHAAWADNRDVRAPADGNWQNYTPVTSDAVGSQSLFDPTLPVPPCAVGQTGMRNQNIYTAKVSEGLFVASPGNAKPLGTIERGFVVTVENASAAVRTYRLSIVAQPPGGEASFSQFSGSGGALTSIDASVPPLSTIARTVYVTAGDPVARVEVSVVEIAAPGGGPVPDGLSGSVVLNADATNPRIQNPRIQNPRIQNPDIQAAEAYNPAFTTALTAPRIQNPRIQNPVIQDASPLDASVQAPRLQNDAIANPGIIDASTQAPRIQNASVQDASIQNPRIQNESLADGAIQDTTWVVANDGNTAASYTIKLVLAGAVPDGIETQLVLHKTYLTPGVDDCTLALQPRTVLLASIPDPDFITAGEVTDPSAQNPRIQNATLSLGPGESANVTLRVVNRNGYDGVTFDAGASVVPAAVAHAVNTEDVASGITTPRVALPLTITSPALVPTAPGAFYSVTLQAFGAAGTTTWAVVSGTLPPGLVLDPATGTISGTPTAAGNYVFTVQSVDANGNVDTQPLAIRVDQPTPSGYSRAWNGADADWMNEANWNPAGVPTAADSVFVPASALVMPRLRSNVTVSALLVEAGATVDTNGFTLTVTGDVDGGNGIVGSGAVVASGAGASIRGTFPNLTIAGSARLAGALTVNGRLALSSGARLDLNGASAVASQQLVTDAPAGSAPIIAGAGASLTVGGVNVNGLTLDQALLTIEGGLLVRFDNVRFLNYGPGDAQLTVNHPGPAAPFSMTGLAFFVTPATGSYIQADDTAADGQPLVINISASLPADGSSRSLTSGGAVVNWLFDPDAASIGVAQGVSPSPAVAGSPVTYTIVVANGGPAGATGVVLADTLPEGATFVSATPGQGSCGLVTGTVSCALGTIPANATVVVTIVVVAPTSTSIVNSVSVTATEPDPASGDNSDVVSTPVVSAPAAADLSVAKSDSADPVAAGTPFTYTLTAHNNGPAGATSVVLTDTLPVGVAATAVDSTLGTCTIAGQVVSCALGTLPVSAQAIVTVSVTATGSGLVTNTASIAGAQADPDQADNAASETTMIAVGGCGPASFSGPVFLPTSAFAADVFAGRLDADASTDIVAAVPNSNAVAVFRGDGAGGFGPATPVPAGTGPVEGVLADLNGDSRLDLALEGQVDAYVLPGNGAGGFGAPATFAFPPAVVTDVRSGDFDNDGDPDLVVSHAGPNHLVVLLNDGAGGFTPGVDLALNDVPARLAVGDFTGDGRDDVTVSFQAATNQPAFADYVWLLPQVDGGWGTPRVVTLPTATTLSWVFAVGDLNGDGHADLALTERELPAWRVYLLFGDGAGQFTVQPLANAATAVFSVVSGDVNGDGVLDLVSTTTSTVAVQLGNGDGTFASPTLLVSPGTGRLRVALVADVTDDGKADIVVASGPGVAVYTNTCGGPPVDVAVSVTDAADPVAEAQAVVYSVLASNQGTTTAANVRLTAALPSNAALISIDAGGSTCSTTGRVTTCDLGSLAPGQDVTLQFTFGTVSGGTVTFTAGVTADGGDTNPADNTDVEATTIAAVGRDYFVTSTNDAGAGSLRQAIIDSNADTGDLDRIVFALTGGPVYTIVPLTALPTITTPVVIDATTQTGYAGTPVVELNGNGGAFNGLTITGGGSTIRGLAINRFGSAGLSISTNGANVVEGTFVGTDVTGMLARPNGAEGILVTGTSGNRIGGTAPGSRNLVSGNASHGIALRGGATTNLVQGNHVGTTADGGGDLGNGGVGIAVGESSDNTVRDNIVSGNEGSGVAVAVQGPFPAANNRISGNLLGTNAAGTAAIPNLEGIFVGEGASDNLVGGTTPADRNVISGNIYDGILVENPGTNANRITGNYIGLNAAGTGVIANGDTGVHIRNDATNTVVGGPASGAGNVISGNRYGMSLSGAATTGTLIQGNLIGTGPDGTIAPATFGNLTHGISLESANTQTTIGGVAAGEGNLIAGNVNGILITDGSHQNQVLGNRIVQNREQGIYVGSAPNNVIGGLLAGAGNVISGHTFNGIAIQGAAATGNLIQGNRIGTTAAGTAPLGNGHGVVIDNAPGNVVGGTAAGAGNLLSGNNGSGVSVLNGAASGNVIQGNLVGTDPTGTIAVPNLGVQSGIFVINAPNTLIGGPGAGAGNLVSGNAQHAITVVGAEATGSLIQGNRVGTNAAGTAALANGGIGVDVVGAVDTTIGGPGAAGNLISGNGLGIQIRTAAHGTVVEGNLIGTTADGTAAIPNNGGIYIHDDADGNRVGGPSGARNLISGNSGTGVRIQDASSTANAVQGNYIGVNATATAALPNGGAGIAIESATTTRIGGTSPGEGNVIAGNLQSGILILAGAATIAAGNLVEGNFIGTNDSLVTGLGNALDGITLTGSGGPVEGTIIGGTTPGSSNVIAFNGAAGVSVRTAGASRNAVQGNTIVGNTGLGIDLVPVTATDGVTPNDPGDADTGGNGLQNFPVIASAVTSAGTTTVAGTLDSTPGTAFRIELFSNAACDPSGSGEGQTFAGSVDIVTDGSGNAPFATLVPGELQVVTATATDADGNTSEFSACVTATQSGNRVPVANAGPDQQVNSGALVQLSGIGSSDEDNDDLTYSWTLVSTPPGSTAALVNPTSVGPTFVADLAGAYLVRLVVNDGLANSAPDDVAVTALSRQLALSLVGTPLVGVGRQATLQVALPAAAPPGGTVVFVSSDDTGVVTVGPPATTLVPAGATTAEVTLNGIASGTTTVRANAEGYDEGTLVLTVTPNVLTVPATLNVPFSLTTTLPISIPQAAPAGGVTVSLVSGDPGIVEVVTPSVTIPAGALSVNGTVRGLDLGTALVTATSPGFSSAVSQVSSTGALNIVESAAALSPAFPTSVTVRLESAGNAVAAPAPGVAVTITAADPACVAAPAGVTIPTGLVSAAVPLAYGGSAALACSTTLGVTSGGLTADAIAVTVNTSPVLTLQGLPVTVGAGLQTSYNPFCCGLAVALGESQHGGVTVHIASSNPSLVVVSRDSTTVGAGAIDIAVPNGTSTVSYYVQGVEGASGSVTLTFSAPGFGEVSGEVTVVQPVVQLLSLPESATTAGADVDFAVMVGLPDALGNGVGTIMPVRAGHTLTATVTNSNAGVAQLQTLAGPGQTRTVDVAAGSYYSTFGVPYGGIAFDPVGEGQTTVSASIPGFASTPLASGNVTVAAAGITLQGLPVTVGAGLQTNYNIFCCALTAVLSGASHGGVTVHIESSNPSVAVLSGGATTAGTASIDLFVTDGQIYVPYYVHGIEGASGTVTITASAPGFGEASGTATVTQAAFQLLELPTSATQTAGPIDFVARVGLADPTNSYIFTVMGVRAGQTVTATVTNSNAAVAQLETLAGGTGQSLPVTIAAGAYDSPYGVAYGGIAFDPIGTGTTTVTATVPGFTATTAATQDVTVGAPAITVQGLPVSVGAGLETGYNPACCPLAAVLSGGDHGGVTMHIVSSNPSTALVSADLLTEGAASIDIVVPDGQTYVPFYVHGVEGTAGSSTLTFTAPGFDGASGTVTVVQPALQIYYLPSTTTPLSPDIDFAVAVGLASGDNTYVATPMTVRAGHALTATVANSNASVAELQTIAGGTGQSLPVSIPAGSFSSAYGVAAGGIAFDPIGGGTTQVSASIPGFIQTTAATVAVTVGTPGITLYGLPLTVGAGLQTNYNPACCPLYAILDATEHGGVTVRIESSNPGVVLVSPDAGTAAAAFIDVVVPNGLTYVPYYVHGVEGASGTVTLTASAPGFSETTGTVTVVPPAVQIASLPTSTTAGAANTEFLIYVGVADVSNSYVSPMAVRVGSNLDLTVTNANADVAQLVTQPGAGQSRTVTIPGGSSQSPAGVASGGIAFDPIASGTTSVTVSGTGVTTTAAGTVTVVVSP